jgi:hypothetical protein
MLDERRNDWWERWGPLAGVVAVALWIIGFALYESTDVSGAGSGQETLAAYRDNEATIWTAGWLFMLGGLSFLWFVGVLRSRLFIAAGPDGALAAVAFAGGVATAVFVIGIPAGDIAAASADNLDASSALALSNVTTAFFVGAEISAIALVAATALIALRGALPRWLAWVSLVLALVLLIPFIGWAGLIIGLPIWVLLVSWLLWSSSPRGEQAHRTLETEATPT